MEHNRHHKKHKVYDLSSQAYAISRIELPVVIWTKKEEGSKYFSKKEDKLCCKRKMLFKTKNKPVYPSKLGIENCLKMASYGCVEEAKAAYSQAPCIKCTLTAFLPTWLSYDVMFAKFDRFWKENGGKSVGNQKARKKEKIEEKGL